MKAYTVNTANLTNECWTIQFRGLAACEDCRYKDTADCGGTRIIKKITEGKYPTTGIGTKYKSKKKGCVL